MTDYQPPTDPNNPYETARYIPQYAIPAGGPPAAITAMSILAIIFGSLGLLCGGLGIITQLMVLASGGRNPFAPGLPTIHNAAITAYGAFAVLVMVVLSATLLAGGIGGLKLRPWARRAMIWWSIAMIAWATLNLVLTLAWIIPATAQYVRQMQLRTSPQAAGAMRSMLGPIQVGSALVRWIFTCALPVCFLLLWRSPRVVAAFGE